MLARGWYRCLDAVDILTRGVLSSYMQGYLTRGGISSYKGWYIMLTSGGISSYLL